MDGLALKSSFEDISNRIILSTIKVNECEALCAIYNMGSKFGIPDFIHKCSFGYKFFGNRKDDLLITRDTLNFFSNMSSDW